jgi:hypothetical protein
MLDESYLMSLPRLKKDESLVGDRSPQRLWALWCMWAAKILGWPEERPDGHADDFSPQVYDALKEAVFPFPKVERDDAGCRLPPTPACTCTIRIEHERELNLVPVLLGAARRGWVEFLKHKGYLDDSNRIVWRADPRSDFSAFSFQHLLEVANPSPSDSNSAGMSAAHTRVSICICGNTMEACSSYNRRLPRAGIAGGHEAGSSGLRNVADRLNEQP